LAIKRLADAWWDSNNHCVVTQGDTKMDQILEQDHDLFFSKVTVEVDMGDTTHQTKTKIKWT